MVIAAEALNIVILLLTLLFVPVQLLSNLQEWMERHHPKLYARMPWVARGRAPLPRRLPDIVLSEL